MITSDDDDADLQTFEPFFKENEELFSLIPYLDSNENTKRAEEIVWFYNIDFKLF